MHNIKGKPRACGQIPTKGQDSQINNKPKKITRASCLSSQVRVLLLSSICRGSSSLVHHPQKFCSRKWCSVPLVLEAWLPDHPVQRQPYRTVSQKLHKAKAAFSHFAPAAFIPFTHNNLGMVVHVWPRFWVCHVHPCMVWNCHQANITSHTTSISIPSYWETINTACRTVDYNY